MSALSWQPALKGRACSWPCHSEPSRAGRFTLSLAGHPVTNAHHEPIAICQSCRDELEREWADLSRNAALQTEAA